MQSPERRALSHRIQMYERRMVGPFEEPESLVGALREMLKAAEQKSWLDEVVHIRTLIGRCFNIATRYHETLDWTFPALTLLAQGSGSEFSAQLQAEHLQAEFSAGSREAAIQRLNEILNTPQLLQEQGIEAQCRYHLGMVAEQRGDFTEAGTLYRDALERFETLNHSGGCCKALLSLGTALQGEHFQDGDLDGASRCFRQAAQLASASSHWPLVVHGLASLAGCYLEQGQIDQADKILTEAERIYQKHNMRPCWASPIILGNRARIALVHHDATAAISLMEHAIEVALEVHNITAAVRGMRELAAFYRDLGEAQATWDWLVRAHELHIQHMRSCVTASYESIRLAAELVRTRQPRQEPNSAS